MDKLYLIDRYSSLTSGAYFPEGLFTQWASDYYNNDIIVYCYGNIGITSLVKCFDYIRESHKIDVIIVIDGGVDGIFRGDEC